MNPIDRAILDHCREDFRPLKALRGSIPGGTLYRHAGRLVRQGWLQKEGSLYRATPAGLHQLAEAAGGYSWDALARLYPPLAQVPTPVHQALVELILAAVVARRHATRPDRHPFFVASGGTLRWKTSLGLFVCHALGLDPATHAVELGTESGRSLSFRRSSSGALVFKRELLEAPFLVLDEFLSAEPAVRATLGCFLSGRLVVPCENAQLTVRPVPLLTLNPRAKDTLEARLGLSPPQIRRALLADFDAVPLPDLAALGERALEVARAHAPLTLTPPAADCQAQHEAIVALARAILLPAAHERVDVEVVVNLCTGMTAFVPEPAAAIAQVGHALGLLADTLGWARPGWIEAVTRFGVTPGPRPPRSNAAEPLPPTALATVGGERARSPEATPPKAFSLMVPERVRRRGQVPDLALSEETRMRIIWFAHEVDRDLDGALDLLLDGFLAQREDGKTLDALERSLVLAGELRVGGVEAETLHGYLADRQALAQHHCTFADVPEALRVLDVLEALPAGWDWRRAREAFQALAALLAAGIAPAQVSAFLAHHRRLQALGLDEGAAEDLAQHLAAAGAAAGQRAAWLQAMVRLASTAVEHDALAADRDGLRAEIAALTATRERLKAALQQLRARCARLQAAEATLDEREASLAAACQAQADDLAALQALRAVLLGHTERTDALWGWLLELLELKTKHPGQFPGLEGWYTAKLARQLRAFLEALAAPVDDHRNPAG